MARQEIRTRLAEADKEVRDAYQKIAQARSKKKSPSKKEKDVAWKALKDREAILRQLESVTGKYLEIAKGLALETEGRQK